MSLTFGHALDEVWELLLTPTEVRYLCLALGELLEGENALAFRPMEEIAMRRTLGQLRESLDQADE